MASESKILTVSYGTFSCTLEGFEDPFDTMKEIAEYFRDLAAKDRYFGAEPPQPDAAMLHRVAERELARIVGSTKRDETSLVRGPAPVSDQPAPTGQDETPTPKPTRPRLPRNPAEGARRIDIPAEDDGTPEPTLQDIIPDGVVAKLARIRRSVNLNAAAPMAGTDLGAPLPEPEIVEATAFAPAAEPAFEPEFQPAFEAEVAAEAEVDLEANAENLFQDLGEDTAEPVAEVMAETAELSADELEAESAHSSEVLTRLGELIADPVSEDAGTDEEVAAAADMADAWPEETATEVETATDANFVADHDETVGELVEIDADDTYEAAFDDASGFLAEGDAAFVAASAETLVEEPAAEDPAPDAAEAAPIFSAAELAEDVPVAPFEAEPAVDALDGGMPEDGSEGVRGLAEALFADPLSEAIVSDAATAEVAPPAAPAEPAPEEASDPALMAVGKSGAKAKRVSSRVVRIHPDENAPVPTMFHDVNTTRTLEGESESDEVARLMRQAEDVMADDENRRRLDSLAHLKAAVAATEAERAKGDHRADPEAKQDPYRDDLAEAILPESTKPEHEIKPRRKTISVRPQEPRPGTIRPGMISPPPLVLVSEQRIDRAVPPAPAPAPAPAPVAAPAAAHIMMPEGQPMVALRTGRLTGAIGMGAAVASSSMPQHRIVLEKPSYGPATETDEEEDFGEDVQQLDEAGLVSFAERVGVKSMAEMLEAAAAFTTCIEKRAMFTRPQLMRRLMASAGGKPVSREDGLRSFGTLLRTGRIEKVSRGHYALADSSPYLAEARRLSS
jgi:hypothetical protein